jgi:predicted DNA-binding protein
MAFEAMQTWCIFRLMTRRNDDQTCLRLPAPLREQLAADAAALGRSVSWVIRKILIEHYAARAQARRTAGQPKEAAHHGTA